MALWHHGLSLSLGCLGWFPVEICGVVESPKQVLIHMPFFSGRVHSITYENSSQGFYILRLQLDSDKTIKETVTVRGTVAGLVLSTGSWLGFEADWVTHETYGKQLSITRAPVVENWTPEVACQVLLTNNVGERVVRELHEALGPNMVTILDMLDPKLLGPNFPDTVAIHIIDRWRTAKAYYRTLEFLSSAGVPRAKIRQIWSVFRDDAETVLSSNPWALVRIDGITFQQADAVASQLNLPITSDNVLRVSGAVRFVLKTRKGMGHVYLGTGEIINEVQEMIPCVTPQTVAAALGLLHKEKALVIDRTTKPGTTAIYEPWMHKIESEAAELLKLRTVQADLNTDILNRDVYYRGLAGSGPLAEAAHRADPTNGKLIAEAALRDWSAGPNVVLSKDQITGAVNALTEPVSIITGLPGSGKTMLTKAVIRLLKDAQIPFLIVAPTGIAAKNISSVTGAPAATIHRAFGAEGFGGQADREANYTGIVGQATGDASEGSDGSGEVWKYSNSPYPADVVLTDESSMNDAHLMYRILQCTRPTARLVFIGDAAQLPSVGPGNCLRDMIDSGTIPTVCLKDIFRQADTSQIIVASHDINRGVVPETSDKVTDEFVLLPAQTEDRALKLTLDLAVSYYKNHYNYQVMSPRHGGTLGVTNLNAQLRELINPKQSGVQEMRLGSETIREGDRIMIVKNNYELEVFNGDVGKVSQIDRKAKEIVVKIHGPPILYIRIPFKDAADHLRLAYAVTVHKMQGLAADNIIMPFMTQFGHQLQRNLLYTAVTRAKKRAVLIGHHAALVSGVQNNTSDARNTLFQYRLQKVFGVAD